MYYQRVHAINVVRTLATLYLSCLLCYVLALDVSMASLLDMLDDRMTQV